MCIPFLNLCSQLILLVQEQKHPMVASRLARKKHPQSFKRVGTDQSHPTAVHNDLCQILRRKPLIFTMEIHGGHRQKRFLGTYLISRKRTTSLVLLGGLVAMLDLYLDLQMTLCYLWSNWLMHPSQPLKHVVLNLIYKFNANDSDVDIPSFVIYF